MGVDIKTATQEELRGVNCYRHTRITLHYAEGGSDIEAEQLFGWAAGQEAERRSDYADPDAIAMAFAKRKGFADG